MDKWGKLFIVLSAVAMFLRTLLDTMDLFFAVLMGAVAALSAYVALLFVGALRKRVWRKGGRQ